MATVSLRFLHVPRLGHPCRDWLCVLSSFSAGRQVLLGKGHGTFILWSKAASPPSFYFAPSCTHYGSADRRVVLQTQHSITPPYFACGLPLPKANSPYFWLIPAQPSTLNTSRNASRRPPFPPGLRGRSGVSPPRVPLVATVIALITLHSYCL